MVTKWYEWTDNNHFLQPKECNVSILHKEIRFNPVNPTISKILLPFMTSKLDVSPSVCDYISLSILRRVHQKISKCISNTISFDTRTHGEELRHFDILTFKILSPSCCLPSRTEDCTNKAQVSSKLHNTCWRKLFYLNQWK